MPKRKAHITVKDLTQRSFFFLTIVVFMLAASIARAQRAEVADVPPAPSCAEGWNMDGKVILYDRDTLFERIDGESELYFPYGFTVLAYARYESKKDPNIAIDADVYSMGSLLDAFGMFANYRKKDSADVAVGAEGTISPSQVFFYQDKYFVRMQVTGATSAEQDVLVACARAIAKNLPQPAVKPKELGAFSVTGAVAKSERYLAQSLLGYDFFRRGLMADAILEGKTVQVFIVLEDSRDAAHNALDQYRSYLKTNGKVISAAGMPDLTSVNAVDPLYGAVFVEQAGQSLIGVLKATESSSAKSLVEQIKKAWMAAK